MAIKQIPQGVGLYTDGSGIDAPAGAMRVADNVLMDRRGLVVPRPGFGDTTGLSVPASSLSPVSQGWPYSGEVVLVEYSSGQFYRSNDGIFDTLASPTDIALFDAAEMRGSLYVTDNAGVMKLESTAASAFERAGSFTDYHTPVMWTREAVTGASGRFALDETSSVAYRYVWTRRDANEYVRRSEPSPRIVVRNSGAAAAYVTVSRLYLPSQIAAGDTLEWYRTTNSNDDTADPGDEMFFAVAHEVTAAEVTAGYVDVGAFWDQTLDAELGAALYTNASQGGLVSQANGVPPMARCVAPWSDVMWYGHTTEQPVLTIEPRSVFDTANAEHDLDGVHFSTVVADFSSGNATLQNVDRVNGLKVGQYMMDAGYPVLNNGVVVQESDRTNIPQGTKIASITTRITVSNHTNLDSSNDEVVFSNLSNASGDAKISWDPSITSAFSAAKGASATAAATNLAAALNTAGKEVWGAGSITATANGSYVDVVSDDGHGLPVSITETTAGSTTVQYFIGMDANAKATNSSASFDVCDYVTIRGIEFYFTTAVAGAIAHYEDTATLAADPVYRQIHIDTTRSGSTTNADQVAELVDGIATAINVHYIRESPATVRAYADNATRIKNRWNSIDQVTLGPSSLAMLGGSTSVTVSFDAPIRPASFNISGEAGETFGPTTTPGRLFWSKPDEPEAVPVLNFTDVGDRNQAILALVPLRNALLVFKEDGIFRVTGNAPSGWVVDALDRGKRLVARQCVDVLGGVAFAWTNRGIVPVTEGGAGEPISAPIADVLRAAQRLNGLRFWVKAHARRGLVIVGLAQSGGGFPAPDEEYVWSRATGAWQRWDRDDACMVYDPNEDRMLACPPASDLVGGYYERTAETDPASYFDASSGSISATVATGVGASFSTVTVAKADVPWTPTVCDVVNAQADGGATYFGVTAVAEDGTDWDITLDGVATAGNVTLSQGFASTMQWQAQQLGGLGQRWQELHLGLERVESEYLSTMTVAVGGAAHRDAAVSTVNATITPTVTYSQPLRAGVPRACVRTPHLYPYAQICGAGFYWELASAYAHHTTTSRRVAR